MLISRLAAALTAVVLLTPSSKAANPPSPLRAMPADFDLLVTVPDAGRLAQTFTGLEVLKKLESFSAYRELLDSTNFRHFHQFVAYYEKKMGAPWPRVLDEIAGGGAVVGVKVGKDPAPTLLVIQGRDAKRVEQFAQLAFDLLDQELARQDEKAKLKRSKLLGIEMVQLGDKFFAAVAGSVILVSNNEASIKSGFDLLVGKATNSCADLPSVAEAAKLLPSGALATLWLNLEFLKKDPNAGAAFKKLPRDDPVQTILFGGYLDIVGRSPFLAAALMHEGDDLLVTVRLPKGRNGMGADSSLHVPSADSSGCRPLLQPERTLFSTSFYLDVSNIWQNRAKLFPEKVAQSFEMADKKTNPFLSGLRISKILPQVGTNHRFVAVGQPESGYTSPIGVPIPAFALVSELREPESFSKSMEATLRGAALLAGFTVKTKLVEEKIGNVTLVGYRFADQQPANNGIDPGFLHFYSPCFARVGDQFLWCSTIDLGRELVGILQGEKKSSTPNAVKSRVFATGVADLLQTIEDQLVTQGVLDRALPVDKAAAEVKAGLALLRSIGPLDVDVRYDVERFSYDVRLKGLK